MLNIFDSTDKKRVKTHLRSLIHIANIDGHFDESEKEIISTMAQRFGITNEEMEQMIREDDSNDYNPPVDLEERFELLYDIFMIMSADDQLVESELKMFRMLALGLNINHEKIDNVLNFMLEKAGKDSDPEILFKQFKKVLIN
jgi:uncharacterized tellurite resistance protein B-like protein